MKVIKRNGSEVDFDMDRHLTDEEKKQTESYNLSDLNQTEYNFHMMYDLFKLRIDIINEFGLTMDYLSVTGTQLAAKVLDYGYSEKGRMLYNFGIEGESYEMVDAYPKYTEKIINNPDGLSMTEALACSSLLQVIR